ncbi:hypothetical protein AVEN_245372-1 [Araneus ventricosus]|uniref:Uncharacterized protein n=1 Tax=Araneus ventricosus TaxID=182803 RepID=A0A4Y2VM69_ARAVE|nr:hypothetical protein AVEN_245372-1 [Araneus ventricosus]
MTLSRLYNYQKYCSDEARPINQSSQELPLDEMSETNRLAWVRARARLQHFLKPENSFPQSPSRMEFSCSPNEHLDLPIILPILSLVPA